MRRAWGSRASAGAGAGTRVVPAAAIPVIALAAFGWMSSAFACTNLATISLSTGWGHPGERISLVGSSFPVPRSTAGQPPAEATPVVVHWASSDGPVLATLTPDRTGSIATTFTIPPAAPGNVLIVAVQRRAVTDPAAPDAQPQAFVDEVGTPARATFRILAPAQMAPTSAPSSQFSAPTNESGSTGLIVMMVLFGAVALSLFGGGLLAFLHQVRSSKPVPERTPTWPPW